MRLTRIIALAVAAIATAGTLALAGTPVQAAVPAQPGQPGEPTPYPPQPPTLTVSDATLTVGETFTLTGVGFSPGEDVRLAFTYRPLSMRAPGAAPARLDSGGVGAMVAPVARSLPERADPANPTIVHADSTGAFSIRLRFDRQGEVVITATGLVSGLTGSVTVTVITPQPPLPVTGSSIGRQIGVGSALVVTGVLLVLLAITWRRRARRAGAGA